MKKYIEPTIKVKEIVLEDFMAASPADNSLDKENKIQSSSDIEAKQFDGGSSLWEEDEE